VSRLASPSTGTAAATGALTGTLLIGMLAVLDGGSEGIWTVALFAGLGAVSGSVAFRLATRWS